MDFEGLLEKRKALKGTQHSLLKWGAAGILTAGIASWFFFISPQRHAPSLPVQQEKIKSPAIQPGPKVSRPDETAQAKPENKPEKKPALIRKDEKKVALPEQEIPEIKSSVYVQAEPVDGYPALYQYFDSNLVYPQEALKDSVQGVITVSFVINREGKAENMEVKQSLGAPFEKEARRLIENMPPWKPATLNGKEVASKISVPLTFQIRSIKTLAQ